MRQTKPVDMVTISANPRICENQRQRKSEAVIRRLIVPKYEYAPNVGGMKLTAKLS